MHAKQLVNALIMDTHTNTPTKCGQLSSKKEKKKKVNWAPLVHPGWIFFSPYFDASMNHCGRLIRRHAIICSAWEKTGQAEKLPSILHYQLQSAVFFDANVKKLSILIISCPH